MQWTVFKSIRGSHTVYALTIHTTNYLSQSCDTFPLRFFLVSHLVALMNFPLVVQLPTAIALVNF